MTRVLLVDDQPLVRTGLRVMLDAQPDLEVVGEAADGAEGVALATSLAPDVVCMDVQMPGLDGLAATRRIAATIDGPAVLVLTTFDRDDYLFQALDAGAGGFLLKNAGPEELITAVRALAAGDGILAPEVTRRVLARFAASATPGGAPRSTGVSEPVGGPLLSEPPLSEPLTEREGEVLALMADARSNAEIASALFIGEATVKTHVSRVLQKLGARDRVQAVVIAHRHGLA